MIEVILAFGLLSVLTLEVASVITNINKSASSSMKSLVREGTLRAIGVVLANKEMCRSAFNGGSLSVPPGWAVGQEVQITQISSGVSPQDHPIAQIDTEIDGITMKGMTLQPTAGPYNVMYNVAAPGNPPDIRNFRRYMARLTVRPEKTGTQGDVTGGTILKTTDFFLTLLVANNNTVFDCFGGIDVSYLKEICEMAFDGVYDETSFPWCTPNAFSLGQSRLSYQTQMTVPSLVGTFPRLAIMEKKEGIFDNTMILYGDGTPTSNGVGIWLGSNLGGPGGVLGASARPGAFSDNSIAGDLVLAGTRNILFSTQKAAAANNTPNLIMYRNGKIRMGNRYTQPSTATLEVNTIDSDLANTNPVMLIEGKRFGNFDYSLAIRANPSDPLGTAGISMSNTLGVSSMGIAGAANHFGSPIAGGFGIDGQRGLSLSTGASVARIVLNDTGGVGIGYYNNPSSLGTNRFRVQNPATFESLVTTAGNVVVNGNLTAQSINSNTTVTAASDLRLKKDVIPLDGSEALDKILQIEPILFHWIDEEHRGSQLEMGLSAQNLKKNFPELVRENEEGFLSIAYGHLVAPLIAAFKELYKDVIHRFTQQDNRLELLTKKINDLEKKLQKLEEISVSCSKDK